jgi:hypothetical protein
MRDRLVFLLRLVLKLAAIESTSAAINSAVGGHDSDKKQLRMTPLADVMVVEQCLCADSEPS